jgi:sulfoxide reductase heme-binding subunit YedZ
MVGLFSLFYALIHFANFVALDMQMDIEFMLEEISSKRFIYLGAVALIMLLFMGFTSTKALFRKYGRYHKVVYFAIILSTIHYIMGQKSLDIYEWGYLSIGAIITISKLIQLKNKYNK